MKMQANEETNKLIKEFIDLFFRNYVKEFNVKFDELQVQLNEDEFNELIGEYDSSNGVINDSVYTDEYVYDIDNISMKKLIIDYMKTDDGEYVILSIQGFER
jgi:Protein of unknown function (DUF1374).